MAQTEKGIIYPYDYNEVADVPSDFKALAESIDRILSDYSLNTDSGNKIVLEMNNTTYKIKAILKDKDNNVINTSNEIDLPLENMVTNVAYNNQKLILTHQDGHTTEVSIADLISDLASKEEVSELQSQVDDLTTLVETELESNEVEGSEIDVSDSAEYRGKIEVKGNTEQKQLSGKNLFGISDYEKTYNGVQIKIKDGEITLNGTCTGTGTVYIGPKNEQILNGTYTISRNSISGTMSGSGNINLRNVSDDSIISGTQMSLTINSRTFTLENANVEYGIYLMRDATFDNYKFRPQLVEGDTPDYDFEPYCGGQASPNPDYPQEIKVVTGDNVVKHVGKNLLNLTSITTNTSSQSANLEKGLITISWDAGFNLDLSDIISNLDSSKIYTISFKHKGDALYLRNKKDNSTNILGTNVDSNYTTYSLNLTNINEFQFRFVRKSNTGTAYIRDIQIEQGSTATPYEPYRGEEYELNLGKNLFNKSTITSGSYIGADGSIGSNAGTFYSDYIQVKPNTAYAVSGKNNSWTNTALYDSNKNFISRISDSNLTTTSSTYYIRTNGKLENLDTIQIEKGATATSYSEYFTPIELCKIGDYEDITFKNVVGDENYNSSLVEGAWYKKGVIGKDILNGTEDGWEVKDTSQQGKSRWILQITNIKYVSRTNEIGCIIASHYKAIAYAGGSGTYNNVQGISVANNWDRIGIYDNTYNTDLAQFKAWLATHNIELYYALLTPTYTQITNPTLISQLEALRKAKWFKGVNHWWTETENLEPNLKGIYKQSNNLRLQALEQAVVALGGV